MKVVEAGEDEGEGEDEDDEEVAAEMRNVLPAPPRPER